MGLSSFASVDLTTMVAVAVIAQALVAIVMAIQAGANLRAARASADANETLADIQELTFGIQYGALIMQTAQQVKEAALKVGNARMAWEIEEKMGAVLLIDLREPDDLKERYEGALEALVTTYMATLQELLRDEKAQRYAEGERQKLPEPRSNQAQPGARRP